MRSLRLQGSIWKEKIRLEINLTGKQLTRCQKFADGFPKRQESHTHHSRAVVTVVPHCASGEVVGALCLGPSKQIGLVGRSDPCEMQARWGLKSSRRWFDLKIYWPWASPACEQVKHSKISGKHLQICDSGCTCTWFPSLPASPCHSLWNMLILWIQ